MQSIFKKSIIVAALLFGAVNISNAQVKVGANPASIGTNSNLEVEATNGNKTIVDKATGQVTIQDGTQGVGKVLMSDINGAASWKTNQPSPDVVLSVELTSPQVITGDNGMVFNVKNFDKSNSFTLPNLFTAPSDGHYLIAINATSAPQIYSKNARGIRIQVSGSQNYVRMITDAAVTMGDGYTAASTVVIKLQAGDQLAMQAYAVNFEYTITSAFLQIVKVDN